MNYCHFSLKIYSIFIKASARENSSIVMRCKYIAKNPAVRAIAFIDEIAMKSEEQKQKFYKSLNDIVEFIPEVILSLCFVHLFLFRDNILFNKIE